MIAKESHAVITYAEFGDVDQYYDRKRPTLEGDGSVHLDSEDGQILAKVDVRSVIQRVITMENTGDLVQMTGSFGKSETYLRLFDFTLRVTESRVIWEQKKLEKPGVRAVGHLRYPWIGSIGYRPKQSFLNEAVLELGFTQDFPVESLGAWFHYVELGFLKNVDPGPLAHLLARAVGEHHLRHGAPDSSTAALKEFAACPPKPDPAKGDLTMYFPPAHVIYPHGVDYIGDGTTGGEWIVSNAAANGAE